MSTTIQIGDGGGAYVFDVPPEFAPQITTLRNSSGERIGERHVWPVRGYLRGAGPASVNTLWNDLRLKLKTERVNVYFKEGETVLQQIAASQTERGPKFDGPSIEPGSGTCWDSNLMFSFEITAEFYDAEDGVIDTDYTISYSRGRDGSLSRVTSGTVRTACGTSAYARAAALAPAVPSGYVLSSSSITPNKDDTEADFRFVLEELFESLPEDVLVAERTVSESVDAGVKTTTYSATFTGPGAERAALDYRPSEGTVISSSITRSPDRDAVSAAYTVQEPASGSPRLSYRNSISIDKSAPERTAFRVDGQNPVIFEGANTEVTIRENGEVIHSGEVPPEVAPLESSGLYLKRQSTSVRPNGMGEDGLPSSYVREWSYTYVAVSNEAASAALERFYERLNPLSLQG